MKKIVVLCGIVFFLLSCEKEGILEGSGEKIRVNISLEDIVFNGNETLTRGHRASSETVQVSLRDGLYMNMTLEPDEEAPTRADALANGVKVRVVAFNGTTPESTTEYTVTGGALTTSTALEVNTGTTYKFVAYSYNSAVSPDYPGPTITVASPHDLLWGSTSKLIQATDYDVSITMNHLFSQVNVKATSIHLPDQPKIMNMTGVTITPGTTVDLPIFTGMISQNATAATQTIPSWNGFNNVTATSNPVAVNTSTSNPIFVNIGSLELDGFDPFDNLQAKFKKALSVGTSYTLVVNLYETLFVGSNIYWVSTGGNDGYLTFDKGTSAKSMCQGVFFKWGSLVGVSPTPSSDSNEYGSFTATTPIYKPTSATTFTKTTTANWADILPVNAPTTYSSNYLLTIGNNWSAGTGDICNFIDSEYRLPNWSEFAMGATAVKEDPYFLWDSSNPTTTLIAGGWARIDGDWSFVSTMNDDGTTIIVSGASLHGATFPAAGMRFFVDGLFTDDIGLSVGEAGEYWGGSIYFATSASYIQFSMNEIFSGGFNTDCACPVRCVKIN
jgi:hypothetical protein